MRGVVWCGVVWWIWWWGVGWILRRPGRQRLVPPALRMLELGPRDSMPPDYQESSNRYNFEDSSERRLMVKEQPLVGCD